MKIENTVKVIVSQSKKIILGLLWGTCSLLHAQPSLQTNIWYFGNHAGLDFNSGTPVALTNSALTTLEGSASIADRTTGNLLFYTDGTTVWDTTHSVMMNGNGLFGHPSSTQSGVIVPDPGNNSLYYVFTVAAQAGCCFMPLQPYTGVAYSVVDMTLNGGLGAVTTKNVQLVHPSTEKITSVRHCNGRDIWVLTHEWNSDAFYAYLVTPTGVQAPVISHSGIVHQSPSGNNSESIGYLKVAPDQQHIGLCTFYPLNTIQLFDFDNLLGTVANPITINMPVIGTYGGPYGCSFSPDGSKFYAAFHNYAGSPNYVFQYDMNAGSAAAIVASQTVVASTSAVSYGALQLASDGKMYMATFSNNSIGGPFGSPTIDRFNNPNASGLASGYVQNAVLLNGGFSVWGLPDYIESYFSPPVATNFNDTTICTGASVPFNPIYGMAMDSTTWNFDDPAAGALNYSNLPSPTHSFNTAGVYNVNLIAHYNCHHDTITRIVTVNDLQIFLGNDTTLCNGNNLTLNPNYPGAVYQWSTGATTQTINVTTNGSPYWLQVTDGLCVAHDSINVTFNPPPVVSLGNDTTICSTQSLTLDAGNAGAAYQWNNGATTQTINVSSTGNYWVIADLTGCTDRDTIQVTVQQAPPISLGNDTVLCNGQVLQLNAAAVGYTTLWSTGNTTGSINVNTSNTYWVLVDNGICNITDTINVQFNPPPVVTLGNDTTICSGAQVTLNAGNPGSGYLWSNGLTTQTINVTSTGNYLVTVNLTGCIDKDTIHITVNQPPQIFLGNDTTLCNGQVLQLTASAPGYAVIWSTGNTTNSIQVNNSNTYWVELDDGNCNVTDSINVSFVAPPIVTLGNDTTICNGEQVILDAGNPGAGYLWSTGETTQTIQASSTNSYTVTVTIAGCNDKDTLVVTVNQPPGVNLGNDTALCSGDVLQLSASAAGYSNLWSTGSTLTSININTAGTYWVQLDDGICKATDSLQLLIDVPPIVNIGNDSTLCQGQTLVLDAGVPGASFLWNTGFTTQTISVTVTGSYYVEVTAGACMRTDTMNAVFIPPLPLNLGSDTSLCVGQSMTINAGLAGYSYLWNTGETTQSILVNNSGTYNIQVYDGLCTTTDSIHVDFIAYPVVALGTDTAYCSNTPIILDAGNPGANYIWSTGETTEKINPTTAGSYWVTAAYSNCRDADTIVISLLPAPVVYLGEDTSLCSGDVKTLDAGNAGAVFLWNDGNTNQARTINTVGTYIVTVTNNDGCVSGDTIELGTFGCTFYLFLPNTFSPNGDGKNDFYQPYPYNILSLKMRIFNRWGQMVFSTTEINPGWDGTYKNQKCLSDIYVVLVDYTGPDETGNIIKKRKKGTVLLLR